MTTRLKKYIPATAAALVFWLLLSITQRSLLFKTQDLSVFLFDGSFLGESLMTPGGFLGWTGSFFTQFLYIPWLGALLWTAMLLLAGILSVKILGIPGRIAATASIPLALLIMANMSLGYNMFIMRPQDYFFAPTLGYLSMLGIMAAVWRSRRTWVRLVLLVFFAFAGYCLEGVFALAGVLAAGIGILAAPNDGTTAPHKWERASAPLMAIALCIAAPVLLYGFYSRYRMQDSWFMGLPCISEYTLVPTVRMPYIFLMAIAVVMAAMRSLYVKASILKRNWNAVQIGCIAASVAVCAMFWYRDPNFKSEIGMSLAVDNGDWQQVTDIFKKATGVRPEYEKKLYEERKTRLSGVRDQDLYNDILDEYDAKLKEPTRLMVLLRDLALLKQDKALELAFTMLDGGRPQKSAFQVPMAFQAGRQIYMNYGLVNMAYRWCLEDQVEHGWSANILKYLATYGIVMDEPEFAAKYLDKLDKTLFYRKWSQSRRKFLNDRNAVLESKTYGEIIPYMSFENRMSNDRVKVETYLMKHFAQDRDSMATPEFDRAALLWAMRTQDIPLFWKALSQYVETTADLTFPRSVQEAAILYSSLEKDDIGIPVDKGIQANFQSFQKFSAQNTARSEREAALPYRIKFGNTFYYYYYFVRGLKTF